jgi:uncharacterized protein with HEPN domain
VTDHDDLLYLTYVDEASELLERTVVTRGRTSLDADPDLRDATLFRLQTVAESTQRLSDGFRAAHPEIPWGRISGFRNRIVHGYLDVDLDIVWAIVEHDLPQLSRCVRDELAVRRGHRRTLDSGTGLGL